MAHQDVQSGRSATTFSLWWNELVALLRLSWPLVLTQIAGILLFTTDVVMMGWLGPSYLAAGSLATSLLHPLTIGGIGVITATAPMIAQAIGARRFRDVRRVARQGLWMSVAVALVTTPILLMATPIFRALGQIESVIADAQIYLNIAAFSLLPNYGVVVYRSVLQAHDRTSLILLIAIGGVLANALINYALMFGNFGFPRLELRGAAISTVLVFTGMLTLGLAVVSRHRLTRRYHILARFLKPDWPRFVEIFRLGLPIGLTLLAEIGLFGVAVIMMGWISVDAVAAHAIAIQVTAISFMVPLGLSMGATVRVGKAYGAGDRDGVGRAGWTVIGLTAAFMSITCTLFITQPHLFAHVFLDPAKPENADVISMAVSFIVIAGIFQFVDGGQVSATAALRGMSDTRVPMYFAQFGYWIAGMGGAYVLGFVFGLGGRGIWMGLAIGLGVVAVLATLRFAFRERLGLMDDLHGPRAKDRPDSLAG